jgi:hypothetical protein
LAAIIPGEETEGLSLTLDGQITGQISGQEGVLQGALIAKFDESERVSPTRSFRFEPIASLSFEVSKKLQLPERLPYDMSSANFSILSQEMKLALLKERIDAERDRDGAASSGTNTEAGAPSPTVASGGSGGAMSALTSTRAGSYYIYTFDGRLLAEYDIYGACLKEYIYMGSRLVAESARMAQLTGIWFPAYAPKHSTSWVIERRAP